MRHVLRAIPIIVGLVEASLCGPVANAGTNPFSDPCEGTKNIQLQCPASFSNDSVISSNVISAIKLGDAGAAEEAFGSAVIIENGDGSKVDSFYCMVRNKIDATSVYYTLARSYTERTSTLLSYARPLDPKLLNAEIDAATSAIEGRILPGLCHILSGEREGPRKKAAIFAIAIASSTLKEAQQYAKSNSEESNPSSVQDQVNTQLLCEALDPEGESFRRMKCRSGGQIYARILQDVYHAKNTLEGYTRSIRIKAEELGGQYSLWNATDRDLRSYVEILQTRDNADSRAQFESAMQNLDSAFSDRGLHGKDVAPPMWIENGDRVGELRCVSPDAVSCKVVCPESAISGKNVENWLLCLHASGINAVRDAKTRGLPAKAARSEQTASKPFLDWLWDIDAVSALTAEQTLRSMATEAK